MAETRTDSRVQLSETVYNQYATFHDTWVSGSKKNWDYYLNKQWTDEEVEALEGRGQAPVVLNRIFPVIQHELSVMSANRPRYKVTAREDGDVKVANMLDSIIQYIWYNSDGDTIFSQTLQETLVSGLSYMYAYIDKYADNGRGEIKIGHCSSKDIYVDPSSKDMLFRDAEHILVVKTLTVAQAKMLLPDYEETVEDQRGATLGQDSLSSNRHADEDQQVFGDVEDAEAEKVTYIERYTKVRIPMYVVNLPDGGLKVFSVKEYKGMLDAVSDDEVRDMIVSSSSKIKKIRVKITASVGTRLLYEKIMPISEYPIVPMINIHTGTPYPMGDPSFMLGAQDMTNKFYSLMIGHAQSSAGNKLIAYKDAFDNYEEIEDQWAQPNTILWANPGADLPKEYPPSVLPNALYSLAADFKYEMEYTPGVFALAQGDSRQAPDTFRATLAIEEFGNRRLMLKLRGIERGLSLLARVVIELVQDTYTVEKTFRIVNPEGIEDEFSINVPGAIDVFSGNVLSKVNDVSVGTYDVIALAGSTLPSNRWALADEYLRWYQAGLIDDIEVLKKLDIFDRDGVIQRKSQYAQMQQQIQSMADALEKTTSQLEKAINAEQDGKRKLELETFKNKLEVMLVEYEKALELNEDRLKDKITQIGQRDNSAGNSAQSKEE